MYFFRKISKNLTCILIPELFSFKIIKISQRFIEYSYMKKSNIMEFSLICHLWSKNWTLVYFQSFHVAIPSLENAENAQARQHVQQQFLLRFSRERLQQYTAVRRSVNSVLELSALAFLLYFSFFLWFHTARLLYNEGQQPSVAPGCTHGIESLDVHFCAIQESRFSCDEIVLVSKKQF